MAQVCDDDRFGAQIKRRGVLVLVAGLAFALLVPRPIAADSTPTASPESGSAGTRVEVSWSVASANPGDCFLTQIDSIRIFWATTEADPLLPGDPRLTELPIVTRDPDPTDGGVGVTFVVPAVAPGNYNFRWYCPADGPNVTGPFSFVVDPAAPATDTLAPKDVSRVDPTRIAMYVILAAVSFAAFWRRTHDSRKDEGKSE
jgi:hypothetical protein